MVTQMPKRVLSEMTQKILIFLWSIVWREWLFDWKKQPLKVIKVKGWRTALVETKAGHRETITPCFYLFGKLFD